MAKAALIKSIREDALWIWERDGRRKGWSLNECLQIAIDNHRQIIDERNYEARDLEGIEADLSEMAIAA